jgi:hypothetical protein
VPTLTLGSNVIALGSSTSLTWSTIDATSCTASGDWSGAQNPNGTVTLTPVAAGVTSYTLTCTNSTGTLAASTVTLSTGAAPAPRLSLSTTSIVLGSSATITWSDTFASSCTASGSWSGTLPASGQQPVAPSAIGSDTYTLYCTTSTGQQSATSSVTLNVTAAVPGAPTLSVNPTSITLGQSATLTWSSSNATACTATGSWSGNEPVNGSKTVTPTVTGASTYLLSCSNASGASPAASATLSVAAATPPSSGGGGGGALDVLSLGVLAGLALFRCRKSPECR